MGKALDIVNGQRKTLINQSNNTLHGPISILCLL